MSADGFTGTKRSLRTLLAAGLVLAALVLVEPRLRPALIGVDRRSGHTELYVADSAAVADGVAPGEEVTVHVVNRTSAPGNYSWSLSVDGAPVRAGSVLLASGGSSAIVLRMPDRPGAVPPADECGTWVRAKRNDSWTRLAARHEIGLGTLLALNDATTDTFIGVGDRLCVGAPALRGPSLAEFSLVGKPQTLRWKVARS